MKKDTIQVWIRKGKVALVGMKAAFEEIHSLGIGGEENIKAELLSRAGKNNYIAPNAVSDYAEALLREYKRFLGEEVGPDPGGLEVVVLGSGCPRCDELEKRVMTALAELGLDGDVQHIRDPGQIAQYGVAGTPALVVNGKTKAVGKLLTVKEIKELFK